MKTKVSLCAAAALTAVLFIPAAAHAAQAQTCAQSYMVCLNNRPDGNWVEETMEEQKCLIDYFACLKRQATEL